LSAHHVRHEFLAKAKNSAGIGGNTDEKGSDPAELAAMTAPKRTVSAAANRTIRALRKAGHLESIDDVMIETVRFTSKQLDQLPPSTSAAQKASLVRAHLAAVKLLVDRNGAVDDSGISEIIAALSTPLSYRSSDDGMELQPPMG
jgi:hypothetical protein